MLCLTMKNIDNKMKKLLLSVLALTLLMPFTMSSKDKESRKGLTVMSYNIRLASGKDGTNSWEYRYPATAMMIEDLMPDVIGMQEVEYVAFRYLGDVFDKTYKIVGVGRDDGKKGGEIMAVMYNSKTVSLQKWGTFWLSETPDKPSRGWDAACNRCATWAVMKDKASGKNFFFVNTHLDHIGTEAQKNGIQLVLDKIEELNKGKLPVVLTGDFNMELDNAAFDVIKKKMSNARQSAVVSDDHFTYNGWGKASDSIDYIWHDGFSSCIQYETVTKPYMDRTFISDHFPIKAVLVF